MAEYDRLRSLLDKRRTAAAVKDEDDDGYNRLRGLLKKRQPIELPSPLQVAAVADVVPSTPRGERLQDPTEQDVDLVTGDVFDREDQASAAAKIKNETFNRLSRPALQVAGGTLDAIDTYLPPVAASRAVLGGIAGAMDTGTASGALKGALDSARKVEGRTVRGEEFLDKVGMQDSAARTVGGLVLDMAAGAPAARVLGSVGGLTQAGKAGQSAPMFRALKRLEQQHAEAVARGDTKAAEEIAKNISRQTSEGFGERAARVIDNTLTGAGRLGPQQKVDILRGREAAGQPVDLAPTWRTQTAMGQRALFEIPVPFTNRTITPPVAVNQAILNPLAKAGEAAARTGDAIGTALAGQGANVDAPSLTRDATNAWKGSVISTPGFVARNAGSNIVVGWQHGDLASPGPYLDAARVQLLDRFNPQGLDSFKRWNRATGKEMTGREIRDSAERLGLIEPSTTQFGSSNLGTSAPQRPILGGLFLDPRDAPYKSLDPLRRAIGEKPVNAATTVLDAARQTPLLGDKDVTARLFRGAGSASEGNSKLAYWMQKHLDEGLSAEEAARLAHQALLDYSDQGPLMRRVTTALPFAQWTLKNAANTGRALLRRPGKLAAQMHTLNALGRDNPPLTEEETADSLAKGEGRMLVPGPIVPTKTRDGHTTVRLMRDSANYVPALDTASLLKAPVQKGLQLLHPAPTLAASLALNRDLARDKPISELDEATDKAGLREMRKVLPAEETGYLGFLMSPYTRKSLEVLWPRTSQVNRVNAFDLFGRPGDLAYGGLGAPRVDRDAPAADRILRWAGQVPSVQVDSEFDRLAFDFATRPQQVRRSGFDAEMERIAKRYEKQGLYEQAAELRAATEAAREFDLPGALREEYAGQIPEPTTSKIRETAAKARREATIERLARQQSRKESTR